MHHNSGNYGYHVLRIALVCQCVGASGRQFVQEFHRVIAARLQDLARFSAVYGAFHRCVGMRRCLTSAGYKRFTKVRRITALNTLIQPYAVWPEP
jgi:hypothetical protein